MASLHKKGNKYYLFLTYNGRRTSFSTGTSSRKIAEQIKIKIENEIAVGKFRMEKYLEPASKRLGEFLDEALAYSQNNKSPNTSERESRIFRNFLGYCGEILLDKITIRQIESYKEFLVAEKRFQPSGVNIELRHLSAAFSLAVKYGYIEKNPFKQVSKLKVPKKKPIFLSADQAKRLLEFASKRSIYDHIVIALNTGARLSEVCGLTWSNVDLNQRTVKLFGKGAKERTVPIPDMLHEYLSNKVLQSGFVVSGSRDIRTVSKAFRKIADKLGLSKFTFHNLRDTYASWLVQQGVNLKVIQELLGHESIQTTMIYAHLAPDSRFVAAKAIDRHLNQRGHFQIREVFQGVFYGREAVA